MWRFHPFCIVPEEMSYNDKACYVAEHFIKNRLEAPHKPSLGINHGRNVPLIVANDIDHRLSFGCLGSRDWPASREQSGRSELRV
jgi:hypothetical protein